MIGLVLWLFLAYFALSFVAPLAGVYQERKIWAASSLPSVSIYGMFKIYFFNVMWMAGCLMGAVFVLVPKMILTGTAERESHVWVERFVAIWCIRIFVGPVEIRGLENLPPDEGAPAPLYIANHASQIDIGVAYYLMREFKWVAKQSVLYLPGVGQIMYLSNHILIDRKKGGKKHKSSVVTLYDKANRAIQSGKPVFFFPQGTRWIAERLPFKDGAFNIALDNKSALVPLSIEIPTGIWNYAQPFGPKPPPVILTIHKPIQLQGDEDKETVKKQCADIIYSVLPQVEEAKKKEQ